MDFDHIRLIIREELDLALAPIRVAIAQLGDVHSREAGDQASHDAGVRAARKAVLTRHANLKGEGEQVEEPTDLGMPADPEPEAEQSKFASTGKKTKRRVVRASIPECSVCSSDIITNNDGTTQCPRGCS